MKLTEKPLYSDIICKGTQEVKAELLKWVMELTWNHIFTLNYASLPKSNTGVEFWVCSFGFGLFGCFVNMWSRNHREASGGKEGIELSWWIYFSWSLMFPETFLILRLLNQETGTGRIRSAKSLQAHLLDVAFVCLSLVCRDKFHNVWIRHWHRS